MLDHFRAESDPSSRDVPQAQDIFLQPIQSEEFLPPIGRWATWGGIGLISTFGTAVMLAAFIPYPVAVQAPATVRPDGEVRVIQATVAGIVDRIKVKSNQQVKQGEVIADLDASQLQAQNHQLQNTIQTRQQQLTQLTSQLAALDQKIMAEEQLTDRILASDRAHLNQAQREHQERQTVTQAEVREVKAALDFANTELQRYRQLADTGVVSALQIQEKQAAFEIAQARLERLEAGLNPSAATVSITQAQIGQDQAQGTSALASLSQERAAFLHQRLEIQNQLSSDRQALDQVAVNLQNATIVSPISGTVLRLMLRNSGQVVERGEAIAEIVPDQVPLVVKAWVPTQEIAKVRVCQAAPGSTCEQGRVQMRVSAYPHPDYGILQGVVTAISTDTLPPPPEVAATNPAAAYYEVTIQPEAAYLKQGGQRHFLQSGMELTAEIISNQETLLTFVLRKAKLLAGGR